MEQIIKFHSSTNLIYGHNYLLFSWPTQYVIWWLIFTFLHQKCVWQYCQKWCQIKLKKANSVGVFYRKNLFYFDCLFKSRRHIIYILSWVHPTRKNKRHTFFNYTPFFYFTLKCIFGNLINSEKFNWTKESVYISRFMLLNRITFSHWSNGDIFCSIVYSKYFI